MSAFERETWRRVKLGDVCNEITVGFVGKMANEYVDEGVPFLRSQDVLPFRIETANLKRITQAFHKRISKSRLRPGDVVVVRTGYPGTASVIPAGLTEANCADLVIVRPSRHLNPYFTAYLFNSHFGRTAVSGVLVGAAQQHFNVGAAKAMPILLPPIEEQNRIASILSAYDDLIEANQRRVAILEEMARRLFEEWFVHLRFPGHSTTPLHDTPDGPVPEGWRWGTLSDIAQIGKAAVSPGSSPERIFAHYSYPAFDTAQLPVIEAGSAILSNKLSVSAPAILLGKLNPRVPRIWPVLDYGEHPQVCSTEFIPLKPCSYVRPGLLAACVSSAAFMGRLQSYALGTSNSHQRVRPGDVLASPVLIPCPDSAAEAERHLAPMFELLGKLRLTNRSLAAARDLLLPRLLSGQLSLAPEQAPELLAAAE